MHEKRLIVFSKAPVAGQVKTRLIPAIGIDKATQLHKHMLEQTIVKASSLQNINCELHCAPDTTDVFFKMLAKKYNIKLISQQGENLGGKMAQAMQATLNCDSQCIIIGTDCPTMDKTYLYQAFEQLNNVDVVLGPAQDGGYVLIGCRAFHPQLFSNISWSTSQVLSQTLHKINQLDLKYYKLDTLSDVDTNEDLKHLPNQFLQTLFS